MRWRAIMLGLVLAAWSAEAADLRGHGGPVRAIALSEDGRTAVTGSFDSTIISWSLARGAALMVHRQHKGAVNTVLTLPGGRFASAGEDGDIAIWRMGAPNPERILAGHTAPVAALALSADRQTMASAAWDGSVRLWPLAGGAPRVLDDHRANVNGVGFLGDGRIVSAAYDGHVRIFAPDGALVATMQLGVPLAALRISPDDEILLAGADGQIHVLGADGNRRGTIAVAETPLAALALSAEGSMIAAAGFRGALALIDRPGRRVVRKLDGPAFPLWSLAFSADGRDILTGGADRVVRRWRAATGEPVNPLVGEMDDDVPARLKHHPGAEVFRACAACHSLAAGHGNRAGPTLHGVFGRKIGRQPGYDFSPALQELDIVWTPETLSRLFEIGPAAYTPGSKMPEQIVGNAEDRRNLIAFLMAAQTADAGQGK